MYVREIGGYHTPAERGLSHTTHFINFITLHIAFVCYRCLTYQPLVIFDRRCLLDSNQATTARLLPTPHPQDGQRGAGGDPRDGLCPAALL